MISHFDTIDFARRIDAAPDAQALSAELRRFSSRYGLTHVIAGIVPTGRESRAELADHVLFDGWPAAWMERYIGADYFCVDPVLRKALRDPGSGFTWAQAEAEFGGHKSSQTLMDEAREHGLAVGFCAALRTLEGHAVTISFGGERMELSPEAAGALNLVGAYAVCKALQFRGPARVRYTLTARELDCVRWCAEGKTDWEISRILGIGESTVRTHIDKARLKLNAANRAQMIAMSLRSGLIS